MVLLNYNDYFKSHLLQLSYAFFLPIYLLMTNAIRFNYYIIILL